MTKQAASKAAANVSKPAAAKSGKANVSKTPAENNVETVVVATKAAPKAKKEKEKEKAAVVESSSEGAVEVDVPAEADAAALATDEAKFVKSMSDCQSMMHGLKARFKVLEKQWARKLRVSNKTNEKKKRKSGNRKPSGFLSPTLISDELAHFLDIPEASIISRVDATRQITAYVKTNNLATGRSICADATLAKLLHIKTGEDFTYFMLQRLMAGHYKRKGQEFTGCASMPPDAPN